MAIKNTNLSPLLKEGANITLTQSGQVITIAANDTTNAPGGSDTQVQFNDGGNFGGDAGLTYNKTTNVLGLESIDFAQTPTATNAERRILWNNDEGTAVLTLKGGNVTIPIGHEVVTLVYNAEATTLNKGEVVYAFGAQGQRISVKRAVNTGDATSAQTIGVVAESIASGAEGWVMVQGMIRGLDTSAYVQGDALYLGSTAGTFTKTKPYAPNHLVYVGIIVKVNASSGEIFVKCQNGYEMDELHNVSAQNPSNNDILAYNTSTNLWEKKQLSAISGVTGTGTQDYVAKFTATGTTIGDSIIRVSGTDATYFSTYKGANSDGYNLFIGGGGLSSVGAVGETYKGAYNSAVGVNALLSNTTGFYNSSLGVSALYSNTTGYYNSAVGVNTLFYNTTGYYNSSVGVNALLYNTTGYNNSAVGVSALVSNTTGYLNSALGVNALYSNTTGHSNSALGVNALYSNTEGNSNTALGFQAGYGTGANANTTGSNNIFIGYQSVGVSATESNRTWIGNSSTVTSWIGGNLLLGSTTTTGERLQVTGNVKVTQIDNATTDTDRFLVSDSGVIKYRTGSEILSDIGAQAALTNPVTGTGSSGQVAYFNGTSSITGESNLFWDSANDRLGIGTATPGYTLQVKTSDASVTVSSSDGTAEMRMNAQSGLAILETITNTDLRIRTNSVEKMRITSGGNLLVGTTTDIGQKLYVNGDARIGSYLYLASEGSGSVIGDISTGNYLRFIVTNTERMRIDNSGNLGLGVTPSAWQSFTGLQVGDVGSFASNDFGSGNIQTFIGNNVYYDNGGFKYIQAATATMFRMLSNGEFRWEQTNTSGTAGNPISFTQAMTLASTGNLLVGTTTDNGQKLQVNGDANFSSNLTTTSLSSLYNAGNGLGSLGATKWITQPETSIITRTYFTGNDASTYGRWEIYRSTSTTPSIIHQFNADGTQQMYGALTGTSATFSSSVTASSFIKSGGTSTQYLMADGSTSTLTNPVTGTGTINYIPKWTSASAIGNSNIYDGGTGVAIGGTTITDNTLLNIQGSSAVSNVGIVLNKTNATAQVYGIINQGPLDIYNYTSSSYMMRLHSSGNLSVGNQVDSGYKLDVTGNGRIYGNYLIVDQSSGSDTSLLLNQNGVAQWYLTNKATSGRLNIGNGNGDALIVDLSGNLGLGVTPSAWASGIKSLEINYAGNGIWSSTPTQLIANSNAYYASGGWTYASNNPSAYYSQFSGGHYWYNAPSGTAGNAISFTQAMTLDANGRLGIGTSSPTNTLQVNLSSATAYSNGATGNGITIYNINATNNQYVGITLQGEPTSGNVGQATIYGITTSAGTMDLAFSTRASSVLAERLRLTSGGNLLVGTTTDAGGTYKLQVNGDALINGITVGRGAGNISNNVVIGNQALYSNTTGDVTIAIGQYAGFANTTGYGGIYIGYNSSGSSNANFNTSIGYSSLASNVSGTANTVLGSNALYSTTGSNNVAIGADAGQTPYSSGTANTSGSNNIFIGYRSIGVSATESNRTWIGNTATETSWIAGNLLLGSTSTTGERLQVTGTSKFTDQVKIIGGNTDVLNFKFSSSYGNTNIGVLFDSGSDAGNSLSLKVNNASGTATERLVLIGNGQLKLNNYTSTTSFTGTAAGYLAFDSSGNILSAAVPSSGIGGSTGSTDNAILRADGTGGSTLQSSPVTISDSGDITLGLTGTSGTTRYITTQGSATDVELNISTKGNGNITLFSAGSVNSSSTSTYTIASNSANVDINTYSGNSNIQRIDATTNGITYPLSILHSVGAVASANGIGTGVKFDTQTAVGNTETGAIIESVSTDVTATSEDFDLVFKTMSAGATAAERVRITSTGILNLAQGQIQFPATQNASSDANTLDDYEEGSFTPSLSATASTFSYNSRVGSYIKIGRVVHITFRIQLNTTGNTLAANALTITSLPFQSGSTTNQIFAGDLQWTNLSIAANRYAFRLLETSTTLTLSKLTATTSSSTATNMVATDLNATGGSVLFGTLTYII